MIGEDYNISFYSFCPLVKTENEDSCLTSQDAVEDAQQMKRDLLEKLEKLAEELPPNTLDELIDELGGPDNVAEVPATSVIFCLVLDNIHVCVCVRVYMI